MGTGHIEATSAFRQKPSFLRRRESISYVVAMEAASCVWTPAFAGVTGGEASRESTKNAYSAFA